ncbi:MAG: hypothetical protein KJ737_18815 [Proteobacteria bacterium]|nr:hypothetical protein [Pseudomonadota bacterium]
MAVSQKRPISIQDASEQLVSFAIDREDLKLIIDSLPDDQGINTISLDYELQILKIISVGWSISVYMDGQQNKAELAETFWKSIHEFSKNISEVSYLTIGKDIDYFQIIRDRLDFYVSSLNNAGKDGDPAAFIGGAFAGNCKDMDNPFVAITGSRIFHLAAIGVKEYLASIDVQ